MRSDASERSLLQRILGIPATSPPVDPGCWSYVDGRLVIDLCRAPELAAVPGALRFEGRDLPVRILVYTGDDGRYHAVHNRCSHRGRRLDPRPGDGVVQCCSVGRSVFDHRGRVVAGAATRSLVVCPVERDGDTLRVTVSCPSPAIAELQNAPIPV